MSQLILLVSGSFVTRLFHDETMFYQSVVDEQFKKHVFWEVEQDLAISLAPLLLLRTLFYRLTSSVGFRRQIRGDG